jgi:hypothetical protein
MCGFEIYSEYMCGPTTYRSLKIDSFWKLAIFGRW